MSFLFSRNLLKICPQLNNAVASRLYASRPTHRPFTKRDERRMERFLAKTANLVEGIDERKKKKTAGKNSVANILNSLKADPSKKLQNLLNNKIINNVPVKLSPRMKQLSTIFFNQIINLIQQREFGGDLTDLGFEITNVTAGPKLEMLIVSWHPLVPENEPQIVELLSKASYELKSILSGMRIIGQVPPIMFHRDFSFSKEDEFERLIGIADMGPEEDRIAAEDFDELSLDDEIEEEEEDESNKYKKHSFKTKQPMMPNDACGVDHDKFTKELLDKKKKIPGKLWVESAFDKKMVEVNVEEV